MNDDKNDKILNIIRIILIVIIFIALIFISIKVFELVTKLTTDEVFKLQFEQSVKDNGILGALLMISLQIIQIFVAIIPGQPIEIIMGMLYGTGMGVILCTIGIFIGTVLVYYVIKKMGTGLMKLFFNKKDIGKTADIKELKNDKKIAALLFIIFLIPAIPKDIFIFFGPFIKIKPKKFFLIATLPRIPGLFLTVYAGTKLTEGSYVMIGLVLAILAVTGMIGYFIQNRKEKFIKD